MPFAEPSTIVQENAYLATKITNLWKVPAKRRKRRSDCEYSSLHCELLIRNINEVYWGSDLSSQYKVIWLFHWLPGNWQRSYQGLSYRAQRHFLADQFLSAIFTKKTGQMWQAVPSLRQYWYFHHEYDRHSGLPLAHYSSFEHGFRFHLKMWLGLYW